MSFVSFLFIAVIFFAEPVFSKTTIYSYSQIQINSIRGPNRKSSYYEDGIRFLSELSFYSEGNVLKDLKYDFSLRGRYTDSRIIDREKESLEELRFWIGNDHFEITLGDCFVNFSQYSMMRTIKGISALIKDENLSFELIGGIFDDQWEYLFYDAKGEPMDRFVAGFRLKYEDENKRLSLNYAYIWDDENDKNRGCENAYKQHIASLDSGISFKGFNVSNEVGYSAYRRYIFTERDNVDIAFAERLKIEKEIGNLTLRSEFEYVDPDFLSLGGSYIADRIRVSNEAIFAIKKDFFLFLTQDYYRNNLEGDLDETLRVNSAALGIKINGFGLSYKFRNTGLSNGKGYKTHWIRFSVSKNFRKISLRSGFQYIFENNYATDDLRHISLYLYLSDNLQRGIFFIEPYIKFLYDETQIRQESTSIDYALGISFCAGRDLKGRISMNRLETDVSSGIDGKIARYNLSFHYKLRGIFLNPCFEIDLRVNDYKYSEGDQNYKETLFKICLSWKL